MGVDERKRQVLFSIVRDYIQTAEPVGSRTIARRYDLGVSPATIRNEMADLEELGYLEQPHTSAGRVPSDRGYRFYVDAIGGLPELTSAEAALVKKHLGGKLRGQELMLDATARLLSILTNYTSIVITPAQAKPKLRLLQVIPLADHRAVVMMVSDNGVVANEVLTIPDNVSFEGLAEICAYINYQYNNVSLDRLLSAGFAGRMNERVEAFERAMDSLIASLERRESDRVVLGGATNILNQPEFKDVAKLRSILRVLEKHDLVFKLVTTSASNPASMSIGAENPLEELRECSIITASYQFGGLKTGHISILGPTRMEYPRVIALLNFVGRFISES